MVSETSPVKDYYPIDFETDLNGKLQEWEAVVLIPFIDEVRTAFVISSSCSYSIFLNAVLSLQLASGCNAGEFAVFACKYFSSFT